MKTYISKLHTISPHNNWANFGQKNTVSPSLYKYAYNTYEQPSINMHYQKCFEKYVSRWIRCCWSFLFITFHFSEFHKYRKLTTLKQAVWRLSDEISSLDINSVPSDLKNICMYFRLMSIINDVILLRLYLQ